MSADLLIRLRPTAPWRIGPDSGDRDRVDLIYHSDSLYSAVSHAMARLGELDPWLDATARAPKPEVRFSSCFPFQGETPGGETNRREMLFVVPPRHVWPPPASSKVRWKGAKFVPLSVVESLVNGRPLSEEGWTVDGASECLVPMSTHGGTQGGAQGPFRVAVRSCAAVDRLGSAVEPHSSACLEFSPGAGLWALAAFSDDAASERWSERITGALRLLADSGFGGERSRGWGRAEVEVSTQRHALLRAPEGAGESGHWMLSLFHPAESDTVDWQRGSYALTTRGGRVESDARWGEQKKSTRMVTEGSVIIAGAAPHGAATDVAPDDFPHPVYRAGFALSIPVPLRPTPVEKPAA